MKKPKVPKILKSETRPMWLKLAILITPVTIVFILTGIVGVNKWYNESLQPLSVIATENVSVEIPEGSNARDIGKLLDEKELIRNATAFAWYVDREGLRQQLQAGTYQLNAAYSVPDIVTILAEGKIDTSLVTIIPGKRLDEIRSALIKSDFDAAEVDAALNKSYNHPLLASRPKNASLEGYIFPETYQLTSGSSLDSLFTRAFDEFYSLINQDMKDGFRDNNLNLYEAITLASIIEKEVDNDKDRPIVAQIFLKRLNEGLRLDSDVTFFYAAAIDGQKPTVDYDSPYNTRVNAGLPPGPISNFSISALQAVAAPANTDYLYFVAGDDGKTYFAKTLEKHEENVQKYCIELCKLP